MQLNGSIIVLRILATFANIAIVCSVNSGYVQALNNVGHSEQYIYAALLAFFKLMWNANVVYPVFVKLKCNAHAITAVMMLNTLVIPIIITLMEEVKCFNGMFVQKYYPSVSTINYDVLGKVVTLNYDQELAYSPPFIYSEECSSVVLKNYVPVFVLMFGFSGLLVPCLQIIVSWYFHFNETESSTRRLVHLKRHIYFYDTISYGVISNTTLPIASTKEIENLLHLVDGHLVHKHFYDVDKVAITYVTYVYVLLTFGVCYPPLAALIQISITLHSLALQLCFLLHYQQVAKNIIFCESWSSLLDFELKDLYNVLSGSTNRSFLFSSVIISCFLIDMLYKLSYSGHGTYVIVILPLILLVLTGILLMGGKYILLLSNKLLSRNETTSHNSDSRHSSKLYQYFSENFMPMVGVHRNTSVNSNTTVSSIDECK